MHVQRNNSYTYALFSPLYLVLKGLNFMQICSAVLELLHAYKQTD
jgi:hypothetical protein